MRLIQRVITQLPPPYCELIKFPPSTLRHLSPNYDVIPAAAIITQTSTWTPVGSSYRHIGKNRVAGDLARRATGFVACSHGGLYNLLDVSDRGGFYNLLDVSDRGGFYNLLHIPNHGDFTIYSIFPSMADFTTSLNS